MVREGEASDLHRQYSLHRIGRQKQHLGEGMNGISSPAAHQRSLSSFPPCSLVPGFPDMWGPGVLARDRPRRACALGWAPSSLELDALRLQCYWFLTELGSSLDVTMC